MNKVFDMNRFGRYLRYDLGNLKSQYGIALLVYMLSPLILYVATVAYSLALFRVWRVPTLPARAGVEFLICAIFYISMPIKLYGGLTSKRQGSDWLMIPASTFEKFLSCMLICLVVAPVIFFAGYYACDGIFSLLDPTYGKALLVADLQRDFNFLPLVKLNAHLVIYLYYVCVVLTFLLGALYFKKHKAGFTILTLMVVGFVLSLITIIIASNSPLDWLVDLNRDFVEFWLNFILDALMLLYIAFMSTCIYLRMRHLKH